MASVRVSQLPISPRLSNVGAYYEGVWLSEFGKTTADQAPRMSVFVQEARHGTIVLYDAKSLQDFGNVSRIVKVGNPVFLSCDQRFNVGRVTNFCEGLDQLVVVYRSLLCLDVSW